VPDYSKTTRKGGFWRVWCTKSHPKLPRKAAVLPRFVGLCHLPGLFALTVLLPRRLLGEFGAPSGEVALLVV
jgi:hypothetical protein